MHGLPDQGGTCPGATQGAGGCFSSKKEGGKVAVCYVDGLTRAYPAFKNVLEENTNLLKNKTQQEIEKLLDDLIQRFRINARPGTLKYRIHTSGDFFSKEYARAWKKIIKKHKDVQFWVYTRSLDVIPILVGCANLALYISCDLVNYKKAKAVYQKYRDKHNNIGLSYLGDIRDAAIKWVSCPSVTGVLKEDKKVGDCARCKLCFTHNNRVALRNIHFPIH